MAKVLAFDFGASSGRAIKGVYEKGCLCYQEVHRFENTPIKKEGFLCWNFESLLNEVHSAIQKAGQVDSLAFDTWGVDFGLLDEKGELLFPPIHYRDERTAGMTQKAEKVMASGELYRLTGIQVMDINSLFQILALKEKQPHIWAKVHKLLFMPDLFAYALCGKMNCEGTIASTSQMLNPNTKTWSKEVLAAYDIPQSLFAPLVGSGTILGEYKGIKVMAVAGHDTQCAVAAMPINENEKQAQNPQGQAAFLSCGTWSLLGAELDEPILTQQSNALGLSNEQGANGKINYLKNIIGLWLIQESRRQWKKQGMNYSYDELVTLALEAPALQSFIDPDAPAFATPGDMPQRIQEYCRKTNQPVPQSVGEITRCIYQSLALKYRLALRQIEKATGRAFSTLHILGGGSQATLLCQMTADSLGIPVIAGPVEATALGNMVLQLIGLGEIKNINEGRRLIAQSEKVVRYTPKETRLWSAAFEKFQQLNL